MLVLKVVEAKKLIYIDSYVSNSEKRPIETVRENWCVEMGRWEF